MGLTNTRKNKKQPDEKDETQDGANGDDHKNEGKMISVNLMGWKNKNRPNVKTADFSGGSAILNTRDSFADSPNVLFSKLEPIVEIESLMMNKDKYVNVTNQSADDNELIKD